MTEEWNVGWETGGMMEYWNIGMLGWEKSGRMECWNNGMVG